MFLRWMLRRRVSNLEAVVTTMLLNQKLMADAIQTVVEASNSNAGATNENFASVREAIRELAERIDDPDDWWRRSP